MLCLQLLICNLLYAYGHAVAKPSLFHNKDLDVFTKSQIGVMNCTEPICLGHFKDIYCQGPILWAAWHFGLQAECPGTIRPKRMRFSPKTVLHNFERSFEQGKLHRAAFMRFCEENFDGRPYLEEAHLAEWTPNPRFLQTIWDPKWRTFAIEIHKIWPLLARRFVEDVHQNPDRYPFLCVPNPFIIPGNLVEMYYYWDSFWIVKGLLLSDLVDTAKGIIRNFAHIMKFRGHIPNSGFIQHSRRSQPPQYIQMVSDVYMVSKDKQFLAEILPSMEMELNWWRKNRTVSVRLPNGEEYTAFLYKTLVNCPRPESLMLDYYFALESRRDDLEYIWASTNSAVESGMDFSTRWFSLDDTDEEMAYTRKGIRTNDIVPVDLNVLMEISFRRMARLYDELKNERKSKFYQVLADSIHQTIEAVFHDTNGTGVWFDYDMVERKLRKRFFPVNIYPLLLLDYTVSEEQKRKDCKAAVEYLKNSGALDFKGGLPASMERSSVEKWDFPTAKPRLIHVTVKALLKCARYHNEAYLIAKKIADGILTTAFNGLFHPRRGMPAQLWDKYDVRFDDGRSGFGGEYIPQTGFGCTNGALMKLIQMFYSNETTVVDQKEAL